MGKSTLNGHFQSEGIDNNNKSEYPLNDGSIETTKTNPKTKTLTQEIKRSVYRL